MWSVYTYHKVASFLGSARLKDFGFRVSGVGFRVSSVGFQVSGFRFHGLGFGYFTHRMMPSVP
jgi:hypothetical protein